MGDLKGEPRGCNHLKVRSCVFSDKPFTLKPSLVPHISAGYQRPHVEERIDQTSCFGGQEVLRKVDEMSRRSPRTFCVGTYCKIFEDSICSGVHEAIHVLLCTWRPLSCACRATGVVSSGASDPGFGNPDTNVVSSKCWTRSEKNTYPSPIIPPEVKKNTTIGWCDCHHG